MNGPLQFDIAMPVDGEVHVFFENGEIVGIEVIKDEPAAQPAAAQPAAATHELDASKFAIQGLQNQQRQRELGSNAAGQQAFVQSQQPQSDAAHERQIRYFSSLDELLASLAADENNC